MKKSILIRNKNPPEIRVSSSHEAVTRDKQALLPRKAVARAESVGCFQINTEKIKSDVKKYCFTERTIN